MNNSLLKPYFKNPLFLCATLLFAGVAYMQFQMGADGDKNWLLLAARRVFEGKRLYVDVFETNPPLIIWLYQLPVFLSHITGVQDYYFLVLLVFGLVGLSLILCGKLVARHPQFTEDTYHQAIHTFLLAGILVFFVNTIYFADREHIFLVCIFPYMLLCMPTLSRLALPMRLRVCIGVLAALGFCIKPHCIVVFLAIQLLVLLRERSLRSVFRMESWIIGAAWVVYLGFILWCTPEYFTTLLPMAFATYGEYKNSLAALFLYVPAIFSFSIAFAEFRPRYKTPYRADILYIIGLCMAGFLYAIVNNGWLYTFYPLNSLIFLAVGWVWLEFLWLEKNAKSHGDSPLMFRRGACACAVVIVMNVAATLVPYGVMLFSKPLPTLQTKILTRFHAIITDNHFTSFGALPIASSPWPRLERASSAVFVTRFHHLWMLPKFIVSDAKFHQEHAWIITYVANGFAEDLRNNKPDVVFVDTSPEFGGTRKQLDLVSFFGANPVFASEWKRYTFMQRVDFCDEVDPEWKQKLKSACRYDVFLHMNRQ